MLRDTFYKSLEMIAIKRHIIVLSQYYFQIDYLRYNIVYFL